MSHISDFDFAICGTGSGGGVACRQLVEAGFNVIAFEGGPDFPPETRRGQMTQSVLEEELKADWLQTADSEMTEYGFRTPQSDQGLGMMVGGSSNHFGMVCFQGTPEDYDEWDYLFMDGATGITGTLTFGAGGTADTAVTGAGTFFRDELEVGDWIQLSTDLADTGQGAPYLHPPFQVVAIASDIALTIALHDMAGATPGVLVPSKADVAHKCTDWNRSKMLQHYKAVEYDIDAFAGNIPASSIGAHGIADNTQQEIGRVGSFDPANPGNFNDVRGTRAGGSGPVANFSTPRMNDANIRQMVSLTGSAANGAAFTFMPDRNNWEPESGKPGGYLDRNIHKTPLNYVEYDSLGNPIAGGSGTAAHTHLNKQDGRRSTLIVHIDRIRQKDLDGVWEFTAGDTTVLQGAGASTDDVRVGDHVRLNNGPGTNFKVVSKVLNTSLTLQETFSLGSLQLDAIPAAGHTITLSNGGGVIATVTAVAGAAGANTFSVSGGPQAATAAGVAMDVMSAMNAGTFAAYVTATKKGDVITLQSVVPNEPTGLVADTLVIAATAASMTVLAQPAGAKAIPTGTGPITKNANFTLVPQAIVDKIRLTSEDGTLTMSEIDYLETEHGVQVAKSIKTNKVVLACGPYGTPGLLLRSGIGAADRLAPHGIPQVIDSPGVGADCLQHSSGGISFHVLAGDSPSLYHSLVYTGQYRSSYAGAGGPRDVPEHQVGSPLVLFDEDPEIQMFTIAGGWDNMGTAKHGGIGLAAKRSRRDGQRRNALTIAAVYKPRSRGAGIFLKSRDPNETFVLRHGVFQQTSSYDAEGALEAINVIDDKLNDTAGALATTGLPAISVFDAAPASTIQTIVEEGGGHYHAVSTCKMGVRGSVTVDLNPMWTDRAVLDDKASLVGAEGVWACDNSIYPTHTRANPHQPTMAHSHQICTNLIGQFRPFGV